VKLSEVPGSMILQFEQGYVPMDAPPGLEEMAYHAWKEAGGWPLEIPGEEWRPVVSFEDLYEVSDAGRVRRTGKAHKAGNGQGGGARIGRILKQQPFGGYRAVFLWKEGRQRTCLVHVLVAAAFLGPCPDGMEVNHKEGRHKWDNSVGNLEYMTRSDNAKHAYATGLRHPIYRLCDEEKVRARQLKRDGLGSRRIAVILGCNYKTVQAALREASHA
jgi:hypothetical protein